MQTCRLASYLFSLATRIINVATPISQKSKLSNNILSAIVLFFLTLTDPDPQCWFIQGFVDEILPRLSLNIHNPEFSSSREDTPGPVIVVATAQLSGGGGGNQLTGTGGLARNTGKRHSCRHCSAQRRGRGQSAGCHRRPGQEYR